MKWVALSSSLPHLHTTRNEIGLGLCKLLDALVRGVTVSQIKTLVAAGTPVRREVKHFVDVAFNQPAGPLTVDFIGAAMGASANQLVQLIQAARWGNE